MSQFTIGEFSRMSGLSVKTLRFYHERELLVPARVETETGYRYYSHKNLETAQVIRALRALDFGIDTIIEILSGREDDADILAFLETQKHQLQSEIRHRTDIVRVLNSIIARETEVRSTMNSDKHEIEEKTLVPFLVGGIRMRGRYSDCGKAFSKLGRKIGRHIGGKAMMLCYDEEYREDDADFEPCMPMKRAVKIDAVDVRELPGGRCVSLIHVGPYDDISRSYGRIMEHAKRAGSNLKTPSREVYLKGPGMIFKGNPARYVTEIQFLIGE